MAAAGTPVAMSSTPLKVRGLTVAAFRAKGTPNTGNNAYILDSGGNVLLVVPKGTTQTLPLSHPQVAEMIDLATLYADADSSGDALQISALL